MKCLKSLLLCLLFALPCYSLDVKQQNPQTLEILGGQVHTSLENLKVQSQLLTEELKERSNEVKTLQMKLKDLTTCLENTNEQLYNYEMSLEKQKQSLKRYRIFMIVVIVVALLMIAARVVTIILKVKGVHLPEIVNILL